MLVWRGEGGGRKGAYCFYLENIIMEELNIRFAQCGHWDCWVHSGVAWLPVDAERKTKHNKKTKRLFASSKRKQGKKFFLAMGSMAKWPFAHFQYALWRLLTVKRWHPGEHIPRRHRQGSCYCHRYSAGHKWKVAGQERNTTLFPIHSFMLFGLKPHFYWLLFGWVLMVFS